ncbi:MAG: DUF4276 family protein [Planctomycetota bacterium]
MKLFVVVEGESEKRFVRRTLRPHLRLDPVAVEVRTGTTPHGSPAYGGGDWTKWLADIRRCLAPQGTRRVTTMFDLYGLPPNFPNLQSCMDADTNKMATALEDVMRQQVADDRFLPFLMRHEFETLVLASLSHLRNLLPTAKHVAIDALSTVVGDAPEDVNCGEATAPSKRLIAAGIGYSKLLHGVPAVAEAGLARIVSQCPRFKAWVDQLAAL